MHVKDEEMQALVEEISLLREQAEKAKSAEEREALIEEIEGLKASFKRK